MSFSRAFLLSTVLSGAVIGAVAQHQTAAPIELPPLVIANGKMDGDVVLKLDMDASGSVEKVDVVSGPAKSAAYAVKMAKIFRYPNRPDAKGVIEHVRFHQTPPGVKQTPPEYPAVARMAHVSGAVVMVGSLAEDGHVDALQVLSGPPMLQKSALDAAQHWIFLPQTRDGAPIECHVIIQISYELNS